MIVVPSTFFVYPAGTSSSTVYVISVVPSARYFGSSFDVYFHSPFSFGFTVMVSTTVSPSFTFTVILPGSSIPVFPFRSHFFSPLTVFVSGLYVFLMLYPVTDFSYPESTSSSTVYVISVVPSARYFGNSFDVYFHSPFSFGFTVMVSTTVSPSFTFTVIYSGLDTL